MFVVSVGLLLRRPIGVTLLKTLTITLILTHQVRLKY